MPIWTNHTLSWFWAYFTGPPTRSDWDAYMIQAEHFMHYCVHPSISLHIIYQSKPIDAAQRVEISQLINTAPNARSIAANALATDSVLTRGILNTINWIAKKPYPERIFAHPNDAQPWLSAAASPQPCADLFRDLIAKVPPQGRWAGISPPPSPHPRASPP